MSKDIKKLIHPEIKRKINKICNFPIRSHHILGSLGLFKSENQKKIQRLHNIHLDKRCFIIGSGPSIMKMDLSVLKNEITFGHNAFYLIKDKVGFLPTYYVVEDPLPAEDNANEINALIDTQKIVAHDLKYCLNSEGVIYPFFDRYYNGVESSRFPQFSFDCERRIYWGGTVVYLSIQLAAYMGCTEIYLIGVDLTYAIPDGTTGNVITSDEDDQNHFHPDYFGKGKRWHDPRVNVMQKSIQYAEKILAEKNILLFNATLGGKLTHVPRVNYDSLF